MTPSERQEILENLELPTAAVRKQILSIFEDLAVVKRNEQTYFLPAEIGYAIDALWQGPDKPTLEEIEFYLDQAVVTEKHQYSKHQQFGYRYILNRDQ